MNVTALALVNSSVANANGCDEILETSVADVGSKAADTSWSECT